MDKQIKELIRYIICGGITTGINLGVFYILVECNIYYLLANTLGYYLAVVVNFFLNQKFVFCFESKNGTVRKLINFVSMRTVSWIVDTFLFFILVSILDLPIYLCRIGLSIAIILVNYIWSKYKIFKK